MTTNKEKILDALRKNPDGSGEEIARAIWEEHNIQIPQGTIRQVKSKNKALLAERDSNDDSSESIDRGTDNSSDEISGSNDRPSDGHSISNTVSGGERGDNLPNLENLESEELEIPTDDLKITLSEKEIPPEADAMAAQYQGLARKAEAEKGKSQRDAELKDLEIEEAIDAELVSDNVVGLIDLAAGATGEPLAEKEKAKGRKVISRVYKRRLAFLYSYGDIVNLLLWIGQVLPKRIFRIKPKQKSEQHLPENAFANEGENP